MLVFRFSLSDSDSSEFIAEGQKCSLGYVLCPLLSRQLCLCLCSVVGVTLDNLKLPVLPPGAKGEASISVAWALVHGPFTLSVSVFSPHVTYSSLCIVHRCFMFNV